MPDELRIRQLLEELLDSRRTPEEVCGEDPDLLREVRLRWERLRRVGDQLDALFPAEDATKLADDTSLPATELPEVAGDDEGVPGPGDTGSSGGPDISDSSASSP
jgi:serine/threonine-protein kinase